MPDQTLCLCMIVRNEAPVIRRCLASVRPLVHHWLVVDTGSTDGTQALVREVMADLPGSLVERPWVDFGHNRSEALALARPRAAFSLVIDADDELLIPPGLAVSGMRGVCGTDMSSSAPPRSGPAARGPARRGRAVSRTGDPGTGVFEG